MTRHHFDLAEFCVYLDPDEAELQIFCGEIAYRLLPLPHEADRSPMLAAFRDRVDRLAADNMVGVGSASAMYLVSDLLEAAVVRGTPEIQIFVAGHVAQFGLSERKWRKFLRAMARSGNLRRGENDTTRPSIADLLAWILITLCRLDQLDVIRTLYATIRGRIHQLRQTAQRDSGTYDEWLRDLAALAVALVERNFVPVTENPGGIGSWHPLAEQVFSADDLSTMRRDEAFFAEQFAHLFQVVIMGGHRGEVLTRLSENPSIVDTTDRQVMRQQLRLMRARYEIPPYLFTELDRRLAGAPPE